jgi:hypothetical protein
MVNLNVIKSGVEKHSPAILTGLGIIGIGSTVIFAVRATPKALDLIDNAYLDKARCDHDEMYNMEEEPVISHKLEYLGASDVVKATWKCYIPAAIMGAFTIVCFIGSNRVSALRTAALSSAYSMTEKALQTYEQKVIDILGADKNEEIREEIVKDRLDSSTDVVIPTYSTGSELCYDCLTGQYFWSDQETIRAAVNDFNKILIGDLYADKNEWLLTVGENQVRDGHLVGWSVSKLLDVNIKSMVAPNGKPCLAIDYYSLPSPDFRREF